jgi:HAD superfamily hydrolase (TIGR01490 family)
MRLAIFDLDHTLLDGDSDQLWCDFLMQRGVLPREPFDARNRAMQADYAAGRVGAQAFCDFYIGTLAGRSANEWRALRSDFAAGCVVPRFPAAALERVERHRQAGDALLLSTATCRFLSEPSAAYLGIEHLIATECELDASGRFTGRSRGVLNMREGKVQRLHDWLAQRQLRLSDCESTFYSDSINDLPLLAAVRHAVTVNPDARLAEVARQRGWPAIALR